MERGEVICLNSQGGFVAETEMESLSEVPNQQVNLKFSFAFIYAEKCH